MILRLCNTIYYIFIIDAVLTDGGMLVLDETGDAHTLSEVEGMLMYTMSHEEVIGGIQILKFSLLIVSNRCENCD